MVHAGIHDRSCAHGPRRPEYGCGGKILEISPETLHNWAKADAAGKLTGAGKQVCLE